MKVSKVNHNFSIAFASAPFALGLGFNFENVVDATVEKLLHRHVFIMAAFAARDVDLMFWN